MGLTPLSAGGGGGGGQTWGGEVRVAYQTTLDAALRETAALGESMHHEWALRLEAERESTRRQLYDLRQLADADSRERVQQVWCAGRSDTGYHTHAPNSNASGSVLSLQAPLLVGDVGAELCCAEGAPREQRIVVPGSIVLNDTHTCTLCTYGAFASPQRADLRRASLTHPQPPPHGRCVLRRTRRW